MIFFLFVVKCDGFLLATKFRIDFKIVKFPVFQPHLLNKFI